MPEKLPFIKRYRVINPDADRYNEVGIWIDVVDRSDERVLQGKWLVLQFETGKPGAYLESELEVVAHVD